MNNISDYVEAILNRNIAALKVPPGHFDHNPALDT